MNSESARVLLLVGIRPSARALRISPVTLALEACSTHLSPGVVTGYHSLLPMPHSTCFSSDSLGHGPDHCAVERQVRLELPAEKDLGRPEREREF